MLWSILCPPCILWVFNFYVFADAIRPGSHPARLLTRQLTPHVSIYDSSLAAAQNRPFVSVKNVSFLFRKRAREREGERVREIRRREQSGQCEIVKQDLCFLSRADALSECLLLVGPTARFLWCDITETTTSHSF